MTKSIKFLDLSLEYKRHQRRFDQVFNQVASSGWFILGSAVKDFELSFARFLGAKHCIGVGNGLEALQISLMSLGVGKGDEVITTPVSAVATTLAILAVGAKPVFVDVDAQGLMDPLLIPQAISKNTKAILPVHLYGNSCNMDQLGKICQEKNFFLIEDACQAHGSKYGNQIVGTFGSLGCFSFYPTKNLSALGDGGAIVTDNEQLAKICYQIRDYGQSGKYLHKLYGLNSRLDELQAAFLKVKLAYLESNNKKRRQAAKRYIDKLSSLKELEIIMPLNKCLPNYHLFVIRTRKRDQLKQYLQGQGIQTLIHYPLIIPDQPFLKDEFSQADLPIARQFCSEVLSLPCNPEIKDSEIDLICQKVKQFFA